MFARIKKNTGTHRRSVLVCHNVRSCGKVRQIIVKTIGHSSDQLELGKYFSIAKRWIKFYGSNWLRQNKRADLPEIMRQEKVLLQNLREESRVNIGIEDIFGALYKKLGFHKFLTIVHQNTLRQIIFARLLEPSSKRRLSQITKTHFTQPIALDRIYRMMDKLIQVSPQIEEQIFKSTELVLKGKISILLFDVTTLSFETIAEDELRAFGFSKDFKFNTTQVVLALATTKEGLPVGYRLFPGNTAESKTLIESINAWRKYIPIEEVTIVGDRAMMSENNLAVLEEAGFYYIVAYPLRKSSKQEKAIILNDKNYIPTKANAEINRYQIIKYNKRDLVITYSQKRADKDSKDRERLVNKLKKKLQSCKNAKRLVNKNGYLKYAQISGQAVASIDEDKIAKDAQWDGLHGVITNKAVNDSTIYQDYKRLWVIEESFRINKHNLKMRPIYHFTPKRIQAHILICYMVFTLIRHAQFYLANSGNTMSVNRIIDALRNVQASILVDTVYGGKYKLLSTLSEDAQLIYNVFGFKKRSTAIQLE